MGLVKRYHADKLVLPGLFVFSLLAAYVVSVYRSAVSFSEPVELSYGELSVSLPRGGGWRALDKWRYEQDAFIINSFFVHGSAGAASYVQCRYLLSAIETSAEKRLEQKVARLNGRGTESGIVKKQLKNSISSSAQQDSAFVAIHWSHIELPQEKHKAAGGVFYGSAQLPFGRIFEIEVRHGSYDRDLARRIFDGIIERAELRDNQLLEKGSRVVAEIKAAGLRSLVNGKNQDEYFVIQDLSAKPIGFTTDVFVVDEADQAGQSAIRAASSFYIRRQSEQVTLFESSNNLDRFAFKTEADTPAGKNGTHVVMEGDNIAIVGSYGHFPALEALKRGTLGRPGQVSYRLGPAAIPDIVGGFVLIQMLKTQRQSLFVELLGSDETILPVKVCVSESHQGGRTEAAPAEAEHELKIEFMDSSGYSQEVFFDKEYRIIKRVAHYSDTYVFQRTTAEDIIKLFPERADHIRATDRLLDESNL